MKTTQRHCCSRIICQLLPLSIAVAIGLLPLVGCSDAESQKILNEAAGKSPFVAKAPPEPPAPAGKAAPAANGGAAQANNAAPQAVAQPADPDAGPADAPPANNANPPAVNPAANAAPPANAAPAAPANNPPAAAAPADGAGGFFSSLAKGVSDRLKQPATDKAGAQPQQPAGNPENQVKAGVGIGKKGQGYGGGLIAAAVSTKFRAEERIIFEIEIPKAMQLYKASNDAAPATHEQFMKEIIEANQIKLPELPAGDRYIYDPKAQELMVEQAK